jgi:hypothetical protein
MGHVAVSSLDAEEADKLRRQVLLGLQIEIPSLDAAEVHKLRRHVLLGLGNGRGYCWCCKQQRV